MSKRTFTASFGGVVLRDEDLLEQVGFYRKLGLSFTEEQRSKRQKYLCCRAASKRPLPRIEIHKDRPTGTFRTMDQLIVYVSDLSAALVAVGQTRWASVRKVPGGKLAEVQDPSARTVVLFQPAG